MTRARPSSRLSGSTSRSRARWLAVLTALVALFVCAQRLDAQPKTAASTPPRATAKPTPTAPTTATGKPIGPVPSATPSAAPSAGTEASAVATATVAEEPPRPPRPTPPPVPTASAEASASVAPTVEAPASASAPPPAPSVAPAPPEPTIDAPADVRLGETLAFQLRARHGDHPAAERARTASTALKDAFEDASDPEDVHVERSGEIATIYLGSAPVVQLTEADASVSGDATLEVHADAVASKIRKAMVEENERTALASRIFSISLVVFFGILVVYLIRRIGDFAERANAWVDDNPHRIPAIRVRTVTMLTPGAFRSALGGAIGVSKWFAQFALGYLWLLAALSLFETTRGYTDKLNSILLQPFVALTTRIASSLPITLVVLIAALVVAVLFRVVGLFFESVRTGTTSIEWIPPELARPTSTLIRVALVLTTLVFAGPVLTGNPDGALARAGFIGIITLGLAGVPIIASCTVGLLVVYGRRYKLGEHVRVGRARGKVVEVGLADATIEDDDGNETRIPHLVTLVAPIELLGTAPRVVAKLSITQEQASEDLLRALAGAISEIGDDPRVELESVERGTVTVSLSVLSEEIDAKNRILLAALTALNEPISTSDSGASGPTSGGPASRPEGEAGPPQ